MKGFLYAILRLEIFMLKEMVNLWRTLIITFETLEDYFEVVDRGRMKCLDAFAILCTEDDQDLGWHDILWETKRSGLTGLGVW
jgi:hypothetical protein